MQNYIQIAIAMLLAYIAWENYRISKRELKIQNDKLRLDLFERRLEVFEACQKFFLLTVTQGTPNREALFLFTKGTANSEFLFGQEVKLYIEEIRKKGFRVIQIIERLSNKKVDTPHDKRVQLAEECAEIEKWFSEQFSNPTPLFRKYLHFTIERL